MRFLRFGPQGSPRRARLVALITACILTTVAACGGGEGGNATGTGGGPTTGALTVAVAGLPSGATAAVSVTGPGGYSHAVTTSETVSALAPGTYLVSAAEVTVGADRFGASTASQSATVSAGVTATTNVGYAIATGSLTVLTTGHPVGGTPSVVVTGPNGFTRSASAGSIVAGLVPGAYRLTPGALVLDNDTYAPIAVSLDIVVTASTTPVPASIAYRLASGALVVSIAGLPEGMSGAASVSGPNGFRTTVTSGTMIRNLTPGSYTITADQVTVGGDAYRLSAPVTVELAPSVVPVNAAVQYALATGRLSVGVIGLPAGATAGITVTGPSGYSHAVATTTTLSGLAPGDYTVAADSVSTASATYGPTPASQTVTVSPSATPVATHVSYAVTTGAIAVTVNGLPQAVAAAISVAGPGGYTANVANTSTLTNLKSGTYTLTAGNAAAGTHSYAATPAMRIVVVAPGSTPISASFTYALASGGIALSVTGLPTNVLSAITVTGPGGFTQSVTATTLLLGLTPGSYSVVAQSVQSGAAAWAPNPASQTVAITPSTSATAVTVNYVTATGSLVLTVSGLPVGVGANVTVTGPNAFSRAVTSTSTLTGLLQGSYTVAATTVASGGTTYTPASASQTVVVGGGATSNLTVAYSGGPPPPPPPPAGLNLTIDGMHIQQVVQTYAGSVPVITGRNGLLRVFVKANQANSAAPAVRVRFYNGAVLTNTITINAPTSSVPQSITEGTLTSSWNYAIPAASLVPGLKILADVDPANSVTESSDADNSYPVTGTPAAIDVRAVPTFNLRYVPVLQSANGLQGGVTVGNANSYLADTRALFPIDAVDVDVRAPFTTSAPALVSDDANGAWNQILSEISALRSADGSTRYYYGIVKVSYGSGIAGLGYVPGRAAIGWDYLPSASDVMAHELGHNFGRFHAPSCGAGGPDPSYPYAGGLIGVYGYDLATSALKSTSLYDLMGYCNPNWISDYTYSAVLNYRASNPLVNPYATARSVAGNYARRGLLVWGRVQHGQVILEPTFEVNAPPSLPQRPGPNRLQGFGPLGETLFDLPFDGEHIADLPDATAQHFAYVIPFEMMGGTQPTRVRAAVAGRQAEFRSVAASSTPADIPVAERLGARTVRLRWNGGATRGVLVRDARSGAILAFGRNGEAVVYTNETTLDVTTSDGVRSARQRIGIAGSGPAPRR